MNWDLTSFCFKLKISLNFFEVRDVNVNFANWNLSSASAAYSAFSSDLKLMIAIPVV